VEIFPGIKSICKIDFHLRIFVFHFSAGKMSGAIAFMSNLWGLIFGVWEKYYCTVCGEKESKYWHIASGVDTAACQYKCGKCGGPLSLYIPSQ
jgi:hypothetical protein